jgi:hypothetical protein
MNKKFESQKYILSCFIYTAITALFLFTGVSSASAHGPKGHGGTEFTALQAVKKGFTLYDQLIASGKLPESWETELVNIEVSQRTKENKNDYVVKFSRQEGNPGSVYIFFTEKGDYSGSNFTGE